jgi:multidrug efflux system outer membrane protein
MILRPLAAVLALLLGACAHVPPDRHVATQADVAQAALPSDIKLAAEGWPAARWWTQYGDAQLDALMQSALQGSPSLGTAAARIASAQSLLAAQQAEGGPEVNLSAGATRQRYSGTGLFPAPIGGAYFTDETVQLQTRYDLDWWGKEKAQIAAVAGEVKARRAEYALAEQVLAAQLAQAYFGLQAAWARTAKLDELQQVLEAVVRDRERRVGAGLAPAGEIQTARTQLADLRQRRAHLAALAVREREALRALTGGDAAALADLKARPLPQLPAALPARLGVELLARRADLQAARWRVEAALSRIEVQRAAFYPDINFSASLGLDTISLARLLNWNSRTLAFGPSISVPLFDNQRLDARLDAARNERNEIIADYNARVVDAVRAVAQAGVDVRDAGRQLEEHAAASTAAAALLRGAQAKLQAGLVDHGFELNARANLLRQQDSTLQLAAQRLNADVALVRALGGGYRDDSVPAHLTTSK